MNNPGHTLIDKLGAALAQLTSAKRFLIGLSGGLDSVVLLHAMAQLRSQSSADFQLRAMHINHQLHPQADSWAQHCATVCERLNIEFSAVRVSIAAESGIENAAREARYREFEAVLSEGEALLLAHHRDDQMETLLLRLMRGSGSRGLSGIPRSRDLGRGRLLRPLLAIDRLELQRYAKVAELDWVEDESNSDVSFDRNYCRHRILPLIEARWPGYRESWSKSAALAAESETLIHELAELDLENITAESRSTVDRRGLLALSEPRRRNVLSYWLQSLGVEALGWNRLQQLSNEVLNGENGVFKSERFQVHCFRDRVYALDAAALCLEQPENGTAPALVMPFAESLPLADNGSLTFKEVQGQGITQDNLGVLSIRYRQGGEICRIAGRPGKTLKKILQEAGTPPWLRSRYPLIYSGAELVCIPGVGVCEAFAAKAGDVGCLIAWQQPELGLGACS